MNQINFNTNKFINFKSDQNVTTGFDINQYVQNQEIDQNPNYDYSDIRIPDMYDSSLNKKRAGTKETIKKFDMMNLILPWIETPLLVAGLGTGFAIGIDKFAHACGGEYEKSLLGKAANFGDKIAQSKFVNSSFMKTIQNFFKKGSNKFNQVTKNWDVVQAIKKTPTRPEWGIPKSEMHTLQQRSLEIFNQIFKTLELGTEQKVPLRNLYVTKKEKALLKSRFGIDDLRKMPQEEASNFIQLKRLGKTDTEITKILNSGNATKQIKEEILSKLGITLEEFSKNQENPTKTFAKKLKNRINKNPELKNLKVSGGNIKWLGKFQPFERKIGLDEFFNRNYSMAEGAKTKLGKFMSKALQSIYRGLTFGGGKMNALLFVAPFMAEAFVDTKKAGKDEKVGTFTQGIIRACSWVFTFPIALKILHSISGMKYSGMTQRDVAIYRERLAAFNEAANAGLFKDYKQYKLAKDGVKNLLKKNYDNQTLFTKLCKKLGNFVTTDLETFKPFKGNTFRNITGRVGNVLRNAGGIPMRLILWGTLSMGVLEPIITKTVKAFTGNYYDRFKNEEFESAKKEQDKFTKDDLKVRLLEAQRRKIMGETEQASPELDLAVATPLIEKVKENSNLKKSTEIKPLQENISHDEVKTEEVEAPENITKNSNEIQTEVPKTSEYDNLEKAASTSTETEIEPLTQKRPEEIHEATISSVNNTEKMSFQEDQNPILNETPTSVDNYTYIPTAESPLKQMMQPEIKQIINNVDNYDYIPSSEPGVKKTTITNTKRDNYTYIPSSENVLNKQQGDSINKYIPSQLGAKFNKTFDNSGLEAAIKRAERAEQKAIQTLSGKFGNI